MSELKLFKDPHTGVSVKQLTCYKGHSHHFYFTNNCCDLSLNKIFFSSDRDNRTNLFSVDLRDGSIEQLTNLDNIDFIYSCFNFIKKEVYFWHNNQLLAVCVKSKNIKKIYTVPEGFSSNILSVNSDGSFIYTAIYEDLSKKFNVNILNNYVGFEKYMLSKPISKIIKISTEESSSEIVLEENFWIGHVNCSPKIPNLLTFCHEGPWEKVDNRIWGLNVNSKKSWPIRPRLHEGEKVGHEYWHSDGRTIGYQSRSKENGDYIGSIQFNNSNREEFKINNRPKHIFSNNRNFFVGDIKKYICLWKRENKKTECRILCEHNGSSKIQKLHVHARLNQFNNQVLFTSDCGGYGNLYLVDIPKFESLPLA